MDQHHFKIRMSVSTKLVLIITFLLVVPIFFLNISAISLFRQDKKAYVYDAQTTLAVLAGREFTSYLNHAMETLKLILGAADFSKTISLENKNYIQFFLDNQNSLVGTEVFLINKDTWSSDQPVFRSAYRNILTGVLQEWKIEDPSIIQVDEQVLIGQHRALLEKGYFFQNISKNGLPPLMALGFADTARLNTAGHVQVSIGYVNMKHFLSGTAGSSNRLMIADRLGKLLFHSDVKKLYSSYKVSGDGAFDDSWGTAAVSGAKEYYSPEGVRTLGSYYKPGFDLVVITQVDFDKAMRATYTLTEKFVQLGLAALGFMIVLGLFFSKTIVGPLKRLAFATNQVRLGNFNINLPVQSQDEFGALTTSFVAMSRKISDLIQEMVDKVRVDQELAIAKTVQQSLFPPTAIQNEQVLVASLYQSASECGGDWWGYFKVGSKHAVIIADATGHGLPSALMTASCRSCFSVIEKLAQDSQLEMDPGRMLSIANRVVYDSAQGKIMMTCFVAIFDFDTRTISFASAAHNPPWGFGSKASSLVATGQRLGEIQEVTEQYEVKSIPFSPNDTFIFYTDGLLEGKNKAGDQYGKKKARQVVENIINQDPSSIINQLMSDFMAHNTGKPLDDDVTLAVLRVVT